MTTYRSVIYDMKFKPILLKQLALDCDIPQGNIGRVAGIKRSTMNLVMNRGGYIPPTIKGFKNIIEKYLGENEKAILWLANRGLRVGSIWQPLGKDLRKAVPAGAGARAVASRNKANILPGNPHTITIDWEVEMIFDKTRRHFKLFKNPFIHDILKDSDIFMTDEHRYIEAGMLDAAKHAGFLAVVGEVQSGKSVIRRKVIMQLQREDTLRVIYPQIIDKTKVTATSLGAAIIHDISSEKPKIRHEQQARQVHSLLLARHKQGYRHVLIIEEAHDLPLKALKLLKRFYELEDGYEKLLGIILIGQPELRRKLDEKDHPGMREVIRRVQISEIEGLNGDIQAYLELKFKRVQANVKKIFSDGAIEALSKRLRSKDKGTNKFVSLAYPGLVNNYAAKAMNLACDMGEAKVTEEIILEL